MIHPHTELRFISPEIGYGVVAKQFIPKGTITWVLDDLDREFTPAQKHALSEPFREILDVYAYRNRLGNYILCWDNARFVNHSFHSNCLTTPYEFEIAIRDIHPGEQLTDDYGYLNIEEPFEAVDENSERKVVYPDDTVRYHKVWDKQVASAFQLIGQIEQPLERILNAGMKRTIDAMLKGERPLDSILITYYAEG
jgi:hypothetical protein